MSANDANRCPECGAALAPGETCRDRFERCLALEFEDWAGYGAVHHLTVPAYILQHPGAYSRQGWLEARRLLSEFLVAGRSPAQVRRTGRERLDSGSRSWRMAGGEPMVLPPGLVWSRTIAGVRLDNPAEYQADIFAWARAVLSDTAWAG